MIPSGMGSTGRVQVLLFLGGSGGLPPSETTFAKRLQQQGYTTSLVGKWHLGVNCEHRGDHCHHPNQHGFSYFYGLPFTLFNACVPGQGSDVLEDLQHTLQNLTMVLGLGLFTLVCAHVCGLLDVSLWLLVALCFLTILATAVWYIPFELLPTWNCIIMRNQEVIEQPMTVETLPQRLLGEAQNFIKRNVDRPFLLLFSLAHIHTPLFKTPAFAGKSRHGRYGDNLEEVDWLIGKMTETVDSLGLANNTLMYFTSDHGGYLEDADSLIGQKGGWNGVYKGDSVFKVHFFTPNFSPPGAGGCYDTKVCMCHGEHVTHHNPPLMYDLFHDPSESRPLTPDIEPRYAEILEQTAKAAERHRNTLANEPDDAHSHSNTDAHTVESQMTWDKILWRPWLQPCCGTFPFCGCKEDTRHI